jgi:diguanylate cyclase (GGDEF)-like protein/PAS domain S-box-containing protein
VRTPVEKDNPVAIEEEEAVSAAVSAPEDSAGPVLAASAAAWMGDSEECYRASFDQAAVGILHTSLEGRILKCNESFAKIVGYSPEELVGSNFQEITPPEDRNSGNSAAVQLLSGEVTSASFEKRYLRKDGSLTWVTLTISIQHDGEGRPLFFLTLVQDINARKQAEALLAAAQEALRMSEERYRTAFQMSLDSINLSRLSDGVYVDCNHAFLETTGYALEEVIGHGSVELNIWENPGDRGRLVEMLHRQGVCRNFEARFRKKNGEVFWAMLSASAIELEGVPSILSIARDISEVKTAQDEIRHLAFYDPLTELPNRRLLLERLRQTVTAGKRNGRQRALLFIDLDNFKNLNDTLGHAVGDLLLKEVGERLTGCIRAADTAARVGGDEFVVILEDLGKTSEEAARRAGSVAEKILASIGQSYVLAGRECRTTASMGITVFGDGNESSSAILQQADIAMYQAKAAGREALRFFAPELQSAVNARAALEGELRQGIRNREFELWYQPQVDGGRVVGAEALLRWNHPRRGILLPAEFISLAEETGLIVALGNQVLEDACRQLAVWARRAETAALSVAVNVSPRQFRQADFADRVLAALETTGANPGGLELEITESLLVEDLEETIAIMKALRARGLRFSLDDFGTGYSSLAYLKRLPLDRLKIDGSFVRDMVGDATSRAIAHAIIWLSREMHLPLLAEGVETEEQRACLEKLGCDAYQGYLFSPPVPVEQFQLLLDGAREGEGSGAEAASWICRTGRG